MRPEFRNLFTAILLLTSALCYGQVTNADTSFIAQAKKKSIVLYTSSIQHQSRLYNGNDYVIYQSRNDEHPYYSTDDWSTGSVVYWGELYENISLLYDLSTDQVITEHDRGSPIRLLPEKVQAFKIAEHTFVRLYRDDKNRISDGFFDQLYDGKTKVYGRYWKTYGEDLENTKVVPRFDASIRYYIVKDGVFTVVKSKGSVLQVLEDRKQDVKNFIRKNRINFKDNREKAIVRVTEFYDTLNN
jgi:hypothetical protein